ncbi:hypothetical protein OK074_6488 [Actinobacteria bacterium OK074]|nr:hypothetical protein OK074_6488 [Actinobacteria bacterium OK074]
MSRSKSVPVAIAVGVCLPFLALPGVARADYTLDPGKTQNPSGSDPSTSANTNGDTVSVTAGGVVFDRSKNGTGSSTGALKSTTSWTPPPCWYAPAYTPAQLEAHLTPIWAVDSTGYEWDAKQRDYYVNGNPYKDFNKAKAGDGYWWDAYVDESFPPGWDSCFSDEMFWVDKGDPPPATKKNAVTPQVLAELAYGQIRVPGTKVTLAPAGTTKVNLPTWAWLDATEFKPVSVTASVPVLGITATATATPYSLEIDPGTTDAVTYPASGVCTFGDNDQIGEAYAKGKSDETPPCGVKYLRSSGDSSFPLKATITWHIRWTGTGVAGEKTLPDGIFGATQNVVVQEIQAVNH